MTLLNTFERLVVNSKPRTWVQRYVEAEWFVTNGGLIPGKRALEIGCGRGKGVQLIFDTFGACAVDAFDLDPKMIEVARASLNRYGERTRLFVGDATQINAADASYDAVFDFAIIHHIPNWRAAVGEVSRVLRPGGRFYSSEVLRRFIGNPVWRRVFDHPQEDRFDAQSYTQVMEESGLQMLASKNFFDNFAFFVAQKPKLNA